MRHQEGNQIGKQATHLLLFTVFVVFCSSATPVLGAIVPVDDPDSAFILRYRYVGNQDHSTYYPTVEATAADTRYGDSYWQWTTTQWTGSSWGGYEFHLTTYLRSAVDQTLTLNGGTDDGTSLFVDGTVVDGGGFHDAFHYDLALTAGEVRKITYAGYNDIGGGFDFRFYPHLSSVENLEYNAEGLTSPVPEPTSLALWSGLGVLGLVAARRRKKHVAA